MSIAIDKADKNPAMKAFLRSSLQILLRRQRIALYKAFKKAANNENLTESRFALTFILCVNINKKLKLQGFEESHRSQYLRQMKHYRFDDKSQKKTSVPSPKCIFKASEVMLTYFCLRQHA